MNRTELSENCDRFSVISRQFMENAGQFFMNRTEFSENCDRFFMIRRQFTENAGQFFMNRTEFMENCGRFSMIRRVIMMKRRRFPLSRAGVSACGRGGQGVPGGVPDPEGPRVWHPFNPAVNGAIAGFRRPEQVDPIVAAANLTLDQHDIATLLRRK